MQALGIDIGGSGIKGAVVDLEKGELVTERLRLETPAKDGKAVFSTVQELIAKIDWQGPIGCGYPGVVQDGVIRSAANLPKDLIGEDLKARLTAMGGSTVACLNDADAAGLAEMRWGQGNGKSGVVLLLTLGTGIGSALFVDGKLVPNTELGHLRFQGEDAESILTDAARKAEDLSWKEWGSRFTAYLEHLEMLFSPTTFILGGGTSKKFEKFAKHLKVETPVVLAEHGNLAGILGAAASVEI